MGNNHNRNNNNPKYFLLDYTHEELINILERASDCDNITEERVIELISKAQFGDADFSGYATTDYVDRKIAAVQLKEGPQGPEGPAGKDGQDGKDGKDGTFDKEVEFAELQTEAKTIIGAINELLELLKKNDNEEIELANVYYGYFPYTVNPELRNYADIKLEYILHEDAVIETAEGVLDKTSTGHIPVGGFIVIAVKKELGLTVRKDDGIGGLVEFDETDSGANGVEVVFDGVEYLLFGEFAVIDGERFIYIIEE